MSNQFPPPPGVPPNPYLAMNAQAKAQRPWFKKKRFIIPLALVVLVIIGAAAGGSSEDGDKTADDKSSSTESESPKTEDKKSDDKESEKAPEKEPSKEPEKEPSKEPEKPKKEYDVKASAGPMIKEFEENELGADAKYKDKVIQVTGVVSKIDTEMFDDSDYVLKLNGGSEYEFLTVDCFDIPNKDLAKLKVGDKVTMIGDFKDGGDLGVEMNHCKLK